MTYTPLQSSHLWRHMEQKAALHPSIIASRLEYLFTTLQVSGGDGDWQDGHLIDIEDAVASGTDDRLDKPHLGDYWDGPDDFLAGASAADPADNHLYAFIPAVPAGLNVGRPDLSHASPAMRFPREADIHDLAATAIFLKHMWQNPQLLQDSAPLVTAAEKRDLAAKALNGCMALVSQRGLDEDFARSCAEFAEQIPALAAPTKEHQHWVTFQKDDPEAQIAFLRDLIARHSP